MKNAKPASDSRTGRIRKNTLLYFLSQAGAGLAGFVMSVVLARHLGVAGYGAYAFVFSATTLFTFAADLGLSFYAFRETSRSREWLAGNYLAMLGLKLAAGGALVLCSVYAVRVVPVPDGAASLLPLGFAVLLLNSLNGASYAVFRAFERAGFQAATVLFNRVAVLLVTVLLLVPAQQGAEKVLAVMVIIGAGVFGINQVLVHRLYPQAFAGFGKLPALAAAAAPFMLIMLFNQLYLHADLGMVAYLRGPEEAGIYAVPARLVGFGIMLPAAFVNALFPSLNRLRASGDFGTAVTGGLAALVPFALPVAACGVVGAAGFVGFFYGPAYAGAVACLQIMAVTLGVMSVNWLLGHVLYAGGADQTMLRIVGTAVAVNVLLNAVAIPRFGAAGAAGATLVTELFIFGVELHLVLRRASVVWRRVPVLKSVLSAAAAAVPLWVLSRFVPFPAAAGAGCVCYAGCGWLLGLFRPAAAGEAAA